MKPLSNRIVSCLLLAAFLICSSASDIKAQSKFVNSIEPTSSVASKTIDSAVPVLIAQDHAEQSEAPVTDDSDQSVAGETYTDSNSGNTTVHAGDKRVKNLANLEALMNIFAVMVEIASFFISPIMFIVGMVLIFATKKKTIGKVLVGLSILFAIVGFSIFWVFQWLIEAARDANVNG